MFANIQLQMSFRLDAGRDRYMLKRAESFPDLYILPLLQRSYFPWYSSGEKLCLNLSLAGVFFFIRWNALYMYFKMQTYCTSASVYLFVNSSKNFEVFVD